MVRASSHIMGQIIVMMKPAFMIILADIKKSTTLWNKVVQLGRINKSNIS